MKTSLSLVALILYSMLSNVETSRPVSITCGEDYDETERGPAGPAGKKGPKGSSGQKGDRGAKGERGQTDESAEAIARLEARISELESENERNKLAISLIPRKDCSDVLFDGFNENGVYNISVRGRVKEVYCDFETDGGNWLVIQRRTDGTTDFYRNWAEYSVGFGRPDGELWIGLENLYFLTNTRSYSLRVDLEDWEGNKAHAEYSEFVVGNAASNYQLTVGGYTGDAGNSLVNQNGQPFTTQDQDNDRSSGNCAVQWHGAWWYKSCHQTNLNGDYLTEGAISPRGISWYDWKNSYYSMKHAEMKIRQN